MKKVLANNCDPDRVQREVEYLLENPPMQTEEWQPVLSKEEKQRLARERAEEEERQRVLAIKKAEADRLAAIKAEMRSRKDECKRFRANGVIPSVGPVVFNQMDLDKDR